MARTACRSCGTSLHRPDVGRPPDYCSPACRRAAEYELRRLQVLLTRAERGEQSAALKVAVAASEWELSQCRPALEFWRGEAQRLRDRLLELLAGTDEDVPVAAPTPRSA